MSFISLVGAGGYEVFKSMDYTHYRHDLGINYWQYMGMLTKSIKLQVMEDKKNEMR